jgi:hypothetical protein
VWKFSLKKHSQILNRVFLMSIMKSYFHKPLHYCFPKFSKKMKVHIFGISTWDPTNINFIAFDTWTLLPFYQWYHKKNRFHIVKWNFVDLCFKKKWATLLCIYPKVCNHNFLDCNLICTLDCKVHLWLNIDIFGFIFKSWED